MQDKDRLNDSTCGIVFDGLGKIARSTDGGSVQIFDAGTGDLVNKLSFLGPDQSFERQLCFDGNGLMAGICSGSTQDTIRLWML